MMGKKLAVLVICALIALLLPACFGGGSEPAATPTQVPATNTPAVAEPTAVPTATTAPVATTAAPTATTVPVATTAATTAQPAATEEVELPSISSLEGVDSYSAAIDMKVTSIEDGSPLTDVSIMLEVDQVNNAQRMNMSGTGADGEEMALQMITIGSDSWMSFGEGWMHTKTDEAQGADSMASDFMLMGEEILSSVESPKLEARGETVNGMVTDRYSFAKSSPSGSDQDLTISEASGQVWVTQDGDYVVKLVTHAEGKNVMGDTEEEQAVDMTWELLSLNQPLDIQPPEGFSEEDMLPIMEGALNNDSYFSSPEMAVYEVEATEEEVLQWYEDTLTAQGWTLDSEDSMEGMSSANYSKDGQTLNVMVLPGETADAVGVMVTKS